MHEFYRCVTFCVHVVVVAVASGGKTDDNDCDDFYCCCFSYFFFLLSRWWRRERKRDGCKSFFCSVSECSYSYNSYHYWLCSSSSLKKKFCFWMCLFFCVVFCPCGGRGMCLLILIRKSHPKKLKLATSKRKKRRLLISRSG